MSDLQRLDNRNSKVSVETRNPGPKPCTPIQMGKGRLTSISAVLLSIREKGRRRGGCLQKWHFDSCL